MPWTTIDNLELNPENGIVMPTGSPEIPGTKIKGALYYFEDIREVMNQDNTLGIGRLEQVSVRLNRSDNLGMDFISVLALVKNLDGADRFDANGHQRYYDKVAVAWPPYYKRNTNIPAEAHEGNDLFIPGRSL
ncbi:MAG: hypothetical protein R2830_09600 [Saprospiraceae bacterium]